MVTFDPRGGQQNLAFEFELARLSALVVDMEKIRQGTRPGRLTEDAPILDRWVVGHRQIPCLIGLSTGHPRLKGEDRPIVTSDLWLMSEDRGWARTLSRWYQLGRPAANASFDA
ncbi:hypothetical protein RFM68_21155 [Mesorhizobium sp. MSK_1335]|uniref:Uncharacterized protein n=1 Tax=Mesorhizobium montanum TaxID=3072323 RepID=A0ABU4ZNQ7_9HYPH|nr:DUF6634 family protein [Mesorhizobium sp. MSK_1335]MDX8527013.1 hypothetical protein [Mesorhizobium sp. MSK_1335]